jgi:hypothetical protein
MNNILDQSNPGASLYRKHVEAAQYGCAVCKNKHGTQFEKIEIRNDGLMDFRYSCNICGNTTKATFSLEDVRLMMRHASMGDTAAFYEVFLLPYWYPHLVNDFSKYRQYCDILRKPVKSRWQEAWEKLLGGKRKC